VAVELTRREEIGGGECCLIITGLAGDLRKAWVVDFVGEDWWGWGVCWVIGAISPSQ